MIVFYHEPSGFIPTVIHGGEVYQYSWGKTTDADMYTPYWFAAGHKKLPTGPTWRAGAMVERRMELAFPIMVLQPDGKVVGL